MLNWNYNGKYINTLKIIVALSAMIMLQNVRKIVILVISIRYFNIKFFLQPLCILKVAFFMHFYLTVIVTYICDCNESGWQHSFSTNFFDVSWFYHYFWVYKFFEHISLILLVLLNFKFQVLLYILHFNLGKFTIHSYPLQIFLLNIVFFH